jgi:hypothetical protein
MKPYEYIIRVHRNADNPTMDGDYYGTLMANNLEDAEGRIRRYYTSWGYNYRILKVAPTEEHNYPDTVPLFVYEARKLAEQEGA